MLFSAIIALVLLFVDKYTGGTSVCPFEGSHDNGRTYIDYKELRMVPVQKYLPARVKGKQQLISYKIFQTNEYNEVPSDMAMSMDTVNENNPEYEYHYYNSTERREFLQKHMGPIILSCYDKLIPNAYKADLFRYSVVYTYGGCYFDIGFIFVNSLRDSILPNDTFISTPDAMPPKLAVNSAFFCAQANSSILLQTIKAIVKRVANQEYGHDNIDVTGPRTFARGFKNHFKDENLNIDVGVYPGGVRLFERKLRGSSCIMWQLIDPFKNLSLIFHKYPRYFEDTGVYSNQTHYSAYYNNKTVYNTSIKIKQNKDYSVEPTYEA